jgi:hypothetical protein
MRAGKNQYADRKKVCEDKEEICPQSKTKDKHLYQSYPPALMRKRENTDYQARNNSRILQKIACQSLRHGNAVSGFHEIKNQNQNIESRVETNKYKDAPVSNSFHLLMIQ